MCGIVGLLNYSTSPSIFDVRSMLRPIAYRGPDSTGRYLDKQIGLGINRLKIIDLETGDQPLFNEDRSVCVVFNGEIYNYLTLKKNLIGKGHLFSTQTDSEVLVHLYEEHGENVVSHLDGMFAFAIWDKKKQQLFIARDKFGIKPLYYTKIGNFFGFGSEPKTLFSLIGKKKKINKKEIAAFFLLGYIPGDSAYEDIHKLPPGSSLTVNKNGLKVKKYWLPSFDHHSKPSELDSIVEQSVTDQLMSDVPVGVFLSGGIDSSLITYFAAKNSTKKINTFSVSFQEPSFDESSHARVVAEYVGTKHQEFLFTAQDFLAIYPQLTSLLDEPFADASVFPTYFLCQKARKNVTVCLSGEGGDEVFGGYPTYQAALYAKLLKHVPQTFLTHLAKISPRSDKNIPFRDKVDNFAKNLAYDPLLRHLFWTTFSDTELFEKHIPALQETLSPLFASVQATKLSEVKKLMYLDVLTYLPDDLLFKADRASMFSSLEVRVPFLSQSLLDYSFDLPETKHVDFFDTKKALRAVTKKYLPVEISSRQKKGFGLPLRAWFATELKELVYNEVQSDKLAPFFSRKQIDQVLTEHYTENSNHTRTLFKLMMLKRWLENYGEK